MIETRNDHQFEQPFLQFSFCHTRAPGGYLPIVQWNNTTKAFCTATILAISDFEVRTKHFAMEYYCEC